MPLWYIFIFFPLLLLSMIIDFIVECEKNNDCPAEKPFCDRNNLCVGKFGLNSFIAILDKHILRCGECWYNIHNHCFKILGPVRSVFWLVSSGATTFMNNNKLGMYITENRLANGRHVYHHQEHSFKFYWFNEFSGYWMVKWERKFTQR